MNIILLRHYRLTEGPSMHSFADLIASGLRARGYQVQELTPPILLARLAGENSLLRKWLGYLDQFVLFIPIIFLRAYVHPPSSLYVVVDQALGPWIPFIKARPHLVHVHDLLSLEGALGRQPFHVLSGSGRLYQRWIRHGFRSARCFLSVSMATRHALAEQLVRPALLSEVVYNPLLSHFVALPADAASVEVSQSLPNLLPSPFLFHIGRTWYKNRLGVLSIWEQLCKQGFLVDLVLVGSLNSSLADWVEQRPLLLPKLHVLDHATDALVVALYSRAEAMLFPSHAEGFGWPILEAMACGCPVITTDCPPMSEVAGDAATLIPPYPTQPDAQEAWAVDASWRVQAVLQRTPAERQRARQLGLLQASRFSHSHWLDQLEDLYQRALYLQESQ
ncbi:glycosyltransferase family 4 protein [Synechococcus sp. CS-1325]|uniref:glycosyltransferase family 4 protein n=1 Tax=unclassified Synechococcus TaxID=2626047 RepID=UPI0021A373EA|nr:MULTISPECIES: glycosyltransferase family 1 protein [unclassified Synechococcus]MCT0200794.1 glycosyltransferase family 4 protein [Synechococcus sp. CS-1325]MCT0213833.1 glycosyltransferase family 4 protein [Synechococcus sp. CS-1326]MCT0233409.1 glycosyltransferase family 4 protein [Synechococcus sp. CS-1327]